jgi:hypothetical protein
MLAEIGGLSAGAVAIALLLAILPVQGAAPRPKPGPEASPEFAVFEDAGRCQLSRRSLSGKTELVGTLDGECGAVRLAWSPSLDRALIQTKEALALAHIGARKLTALPRPSPGAVDEIGFDEQGQGWALTVGESVVIAKGQTAIQFQGKPIAVSAQSAGSEVSLVHAFRLDGSAWTLVQTAAAPFNPYGSKTAEVSPKFARSKSTEPAAFGTPVAAERKALAAAFKDLKPDEGTQEWGKLASPKGALFVWRASGDRMHSLNHLAFQKDGAAVPTAPDGGNGDQIEVYRAGEDLALVVDEYSWRHARLLDLAARTVVAKVPWKDGDAVLPWPHP